MIILNQYTLLLTVNNTYVNTSSTTIIVGTGPPITTKDCPFSPAAAAATAAASHAPNGPTSVSRIAPTIASINGEVPIAAAAAAAASYLTVHQITATVAANMAAATAVADGC